MGTRELLGQPVQMLQVACNGKFSPLGKIAMHLPACFKVVTTWICFSVARVQILGHVCK